MAALTGNVEGQEATPRRFRMDGRMEGSVGWMEGCMEGRTDKSTPCLPAAALQKGERLAHAVRGRSSGPSIDCLQHPRLEATAFQTLPVAICGFVLRMAG